MGVNEIISIAYREILRYLESEEHLGETPFHTVQYFPSSLYIYIYIIQINKELFNFLGNAIISLHDTLLNPLPTSGHTCSVLFNTKSLPFAHTTYILFQYDFYNHHR